jgi:hypothetical protein
VVPVDARRVKPHEDANDVAAEQVQDFAGRLPRQSQTPLFVFDAGYDPVRLQLELQGCAAQILVRLNSGRVFYFDPEPPPRRHVGHPRTHGEKFDLKEPGSWPEPTHEHYCLTDSYGSVRVRAWSSLHPKTRKAKERYGSKSACVVKGTVVLVEVGHLPQGERRREPKALRLWWNGEGEPDLDLLWRAYTRRFDVEHAVKFLKGALGWSTLRVRHPEQADRRLPWERPLPARKLTPYRVLRSFVTTPS